MLLPVQIETPPALVEIAIVRALNFSDLHAPISFIDDEGNDN